MAFLADNGDPRAINKDSGVYRTTYWGFPFEALSGDPARVESLGAYLTWCDALPVTHNITLGDGWNLISSNVEPDETPLVDLFADVSGLTLLKNGLGQVYWPAYNINQIGDWNSLQGYELHMANPSSVAINGSEIVPQETPISMAAGWNMISYLRRSATEIGPAMIPIAGEIVLAKNGAGQVYWPDMSINTIGNMEPGQGYKVYMNAAGTLTYADN